MILQGYQLPALVEQGAHALPPSPAGECLVDVGNLLLGRGPRLPLHEVVALNGCLAADFQVGEAGDKTVEALQVGRAVERFHLVGALLLQQLKGREQLGGAVAAAGIVVAQHVDAPGLVADDGEQVVVEEAAVAALVYDRLVCLCLGGGQQVRVLQCTAVVLVGNLLVQVFVELAVGLIDISQHRAIDGPQHAVLGLLLAHLQSLYGGFQRVGADAAQRAGLAQLGLQQLSIVALSLGYLGNLAQQLLLRLGQILFFGLTHFLP